MNIWYLGYYDIKSNQNEQRSFSPAAATKLAYIADALSSICKTMIVSPSQTTGRKSFSGRIIKINNNLSLKLFYTFGRKNVLMRFISYLYQRVSSLLYLLKSIKSTDILIVYHSLAYMNTVRIVKYLCKCKLIIEVEEIYGDVFLDLKTVKKELRYFNIADGYIFPTTALDQKINKSHKPYCIIHGTYQTEPLCIQKANNSVIHVVYAGTFDPRKGGAIAAVAAAEYLPENYHVHIMGFGSESQITNIKKSIKSVSSKTKSMITYDGCLTGSEYIEFIQNCDIGLSTQNPDADFNSTSFPSKILSYMANGLHVVSVRIPVIEGSDVGKYLYYYDEQTPQSIAEAIKSVEMNNTFNSKVIVKELDIRFRANLKLLISKIQRI